MRASRFSLALIVGLAGCNTAPQPAAQNDVFAAPPSVKKVDAEDAFPRPGTYRIVHERPDGREETRMWVDAGNRQTFEALVARDDGSNCRDRQLTIENGGFSVSMTCDAPDGDIHNIAIRRDGSYSSDSITINTEMILWGSPIKETTTYQRQDD